MALFYTGDGISFTCSNLAAAKQFWIEIFGCREVKVPPDWDDSLPSDIALKLPGEDAPGIGLSDKGQVERAGFDRTNPRPILFCNDIQKAHAYLGVRGVRSGEISELGGMQFFQIQDIEGNVIEICHEK